MTVVESSRSSCLDAGVADQGSHVTYTYPPPYSEHRADVPAHVPLKARRRRIGTFYSAWLAVVHKPTVNDSGMPLVPKTGDIFPGLPASPHRISATGLGRASHRPRNLPHWARACCPDGEAFEASRRVVYCIGAIPLLRWRQGHMTRCKGSRDRAN